MQTAERKHRLALWRQKRVRRKELFQLDLMTLYRAEAHTWCQGWTFIVYTLAFFLHSCILYRIYVYMSYDKEKTRTCLARDIVFNRPEVSKITLHTFPDEDENDNHNEDDHEDDEYLIACWYVSMWH